MPPPNSMRAHASSQTTSGNRSPPRQVAKAPNQAPGAMRGFSPNSGMAATAQSTPPAGMTSPGDSWRDMPRKDPPAPISNRKVPHGYRGDRS